MNFTIREMQPEDGAKVLSIFEEGIKGGNATFDTEVPTWESWDMNFHKTCRLILEDESNEILGWAALKPISKRTCYSGVAEVSIYISFKAHGKGLGKVLLQRLVQQSEDHGFWTLQSGIFPSNVASLSVHHKVGFRTVGKRERIAKLKGVWTDSLLLERRSQVLN